MLWCFPVTIGLFCFFPKCNFYNQSKLKQYQLPRPCFHTNAYKLKHVAWSKGWNMLVEKRAVAVYSLIFGTKNLQLWFLQLICNTVHPNVNNIDKVYDLFHQHRKSYIIYTFWRSRGSPWQQADSLTPSDSASVTTSESNNMYRFGDDNQVKATRTAIIPVTIGHHNIKLVTDIVDREILALLLSRETMKKIGMSIDVETDKAVIFGTPINLHETKSGCSLSNNQPWDMEIYLTPRWLYPTKRSWVGYMKLRCGINPISHGWLLDKYFILSKSNFKRNETLKSLAMGYWNLSNDHQPIRTRQISMR